MQILFENKYTRTKKFFRETYFYDHFKKSFNIILMLFMAALLAPNLFFAVKSSWHDIISDISVGIGIIFFIVYFIAYPVRVDIAAKNEKKLDSENIYTLSATENKIIYRAPNCPEIEISFAKIKKVSKSKNYIMLISEDVLFEIRSEYSWSESDYAYRSCHSLQITVADGALRQFSRKNPTPDEYVYLTLQTSPNKTETVKYIRCYG